MIKLTKQNVLNYHFNEDDVKIWWKNYIVTCKENNVMPNYIKISFNLDTIKLIFN